MPAESIILEQVKSCGSVSCLINTERLELLRPQPREWIASDSAHQTQLKREIPLPITLFVTILQKINLYWHNNEMSGCDKGKLLINLAQIKKSAKSVNLHKTEEI